MKHTLAEPTVERREAILRAAAILFARDGIAETNLRQIARQAGISSGTLHYYFPSKDNLVATLILDAVRPMGQQAWEIAHGGRHPLEGLREIVRLTFEQLDSNWEVYFVALLLGDHLRAKLSGAFPTATEAITELVRRGQEAGLLRAGDPLLLAILCHGILLRVPRARAFGELQPPISQYAEEVVEACWRVLAK